MDAETAAAPCTFLEHGGCFGRCDGRPDCEVAKEREEYDDDLRDCHVPVPVVDLSASFAAGGPSDRCVR